MHEWRSCSQRAHAGLCVVAACSAVGRVSVCRKGPWSGCAQQIEIAHCVCTVRVRLRGPSRGMCGGGLYVVEPWGGLVSAGTVLGRDVLSRTSLCVYVKNSGHNGARSAPPVS